MPLRTDSKRERQIQAERRLLAGLCQGSLGPRTHEEVLRRLTACKFANAEHDVVFKTLSSLPDVGPERIREALLLRLTRLGFPDVDIESLFTAPPPSDAEISALIELLA